MSVDKKTGARHYHGERAKVANGDHYAVNDRAGSNTKSPARKPTKLHIDVKRNDAL
jgi:hypothetical protein